MAGGKIVGLRSYYFFDQMDVEYSENIANSLQTWYTDWLKQRLQKILQKGDYDFVFTMMSSPDTHAHNKASAIFGLAKHPAASKERASHRAGN
ncbi:MAG: hypothetical protein U5J63_09735 [Fodinibius sp.]|nr:hypothetical protein [Fodinibius sp.]